MDNVDGVRQRGRVILVDAFVAQLWGFELNSAGIYPVTRLHPNFLTNHKGSIITYHIRGEDGLEFICLKGSETLPGT